MTDIGTWNEHRAKENLATAAPPCEVNLRDDAVDATEGLPALVWSGSVFRFAGALVRAMSLDDVAMAIATHAAAVMGARCTHVALLDEDGRVAVSLFAGQGLPSRRLRGRRGQDRFPWDETLRTGTAQVFPSTADLHKVYPDTVALWQAPATGPVVTVPLSAAGEIRGAVTFGFPPGSPLRVENDPVLAEISSLAAQAAQAAQRGAVHDTERRCTEVLQAAYLPARLPSIPSLALASRYFPADDPFAVGGDWYDAIELSEARVVLTIGDVAGHGVKAATTMGSLRSALRALAMVEPSPAAILTLLNAYVAKFKPEAFATALVAVIDSAGGVLRYAIAGHPPAVLVDADGSAELLTEPLGPPLGLAGSRYGEGERLLAAGSALILYSDGLVERRLTSLEETIADLVQSASGKYAATAEEICDRVTGRLLSGVELFDDACVLVAMRPRLTRPSATG
jgi:hypothetical protein